MLVEASIHGGNVNIHVGVLLRHPGNALGRADDGHEFDMLAALFLQKADGVAGAAARGKHGIHHHDQLILNAHGKLAVVRIGLQRFLVSVHADVPHLGGGKQHVHAVDHAESRAQDRNDDDGVILHHPLAADLQGGLHLDLRGGHALLQALVGHQRGDLLHQLPEFLHAGALVAENGDLMADQRMIENNDVFIVLHSSSSSLLFFLQVQEVVDDDTEDQRACDGGDDHLADGHGHAAHARDENGGNGKEVGVVAEIHLLDHLKTGNRDKAVKRHANTAHHAAGNGIQERHEGRNKGNEHRQHGGNRNGDDGGVPGDGNAAHRLAVRGIGAAAEEGARNGAHTVTQQRAMEAGVLQQILLNDGGEVLVVRNMLREYHEGHGNIRHRNGCQIAGVHILDAVKGRKEGEVRQRDKRAELYAVCRQRGKGGKVNDLQCIHAGSVADSRKHQRHRIARQHANDKGNELGHLFSIAGAQDHHNERDHGAGEGGPRMARHDKFAVFGYGAVGENILYSGRGQRQADQRHRGTDDHRGHQLIDPSHAHKLDHQRDDHVNEARKQRTDEKSEITEAHGGGAREGSRHGADKGKGRAEENGAAEPCEELVHQRADACTKQRGRCGHAVSNHSGNGNGGGHDRQKLLDRKDDQLVEAGLVLNVVNQIFSHFLPPVCSKNSILGNAFWR